MVMVATATAAIDNSSMQALRGQFRGALLRAQEEGYDEARRIWNGAIDRYPALDRPLRWARTMSSRPCASPASTTCPSRCGAVDTPSPATPSATAGS